MYKIRSISINQSIYLYVFWCDPADLTTQNFKSYISWTFRNPGYFSCGL